MSPEDKQFVETLREQYAPPPMNGADVTRFDTQLAAKRRQRVQRTWVGGLATAAAAILIAVGLSGAPTPEPAAPSLPASDVQWAEALAFEDLDINPFAFLDLDAAVAAEDTNETYAIESDWPADFEGLSYLIEPTEKEI